MKEKQQTEFEELFQLEDNIDFSIKLGEILGIYEDTETSLKTLCIPKKVLGLCKMIEDAGQADTILNFFVEFPGYVEEAVKALFEIGAKKSAKIIKLAVDLYFSLPKDSIGWNPGGKWDKEAWDKLMEFDSQFSNYPDGSMRDLYRKYAKKHKRELILDMQTPN